MDCQKCGGATVVVDSRPSEDAVYRRRRCLDCGALMYTEEKELVGENRSSYMNACKVKLYQRFKSL